MDGPAYLSHNGNDGCDVPGTPVMTEMSEQANCSYVVFVGDGFHFIDEDQRYQLRARAGKVLQCKEGTRRRWYDLEQ